MVTLTFPQPAKRISMNDRTHWRSKANATKLWRDAARAAGERPSFVKPRPVAYSLGPSFVRVTFPVRDARRRDADNPAPTVKAIVDGLVDARYWPDDSPEWVETLGSRFAKGAEVVTVEIIPRGELVA